MFFIILSLPSSLSLIIAGICYTVYGEAYSHWVKGKVDLENEDQRIVEFFGREVFISTPNNYLLRSDEGKLVELDSGTHSYDFSFQLPQELPGSFEAFYGHIRYNVEAFIDAPWDGKKELKLEFTVASNVNLNELPEVKIPCKSEEVTSFCYWCLCTSDPLNLTVTLPYAGFVPGQNIPMTIDIDNKTTVEILWTKITFTRKVEFTCDSPKLKTKTELNKILEVLIEGASELSTKRIQKELPLPHVLTSSTLELCKIIKISYDLRVEFETSGCHCNPFFDIPITIGVIPLDIEAFPFSFTEATAPTLRKLAKIHLFMWLA